MVVCFLFYLFLKAVRFSGQSSVCSEIVKVFFVFLRCDNKSCRAEESNVEDEFQKEVPYCVESEC